MFKSLATVCATTISTPEGKSANGQRQSEILQDYITSTTLQAQTNMFKFHMLIAYYSIPK